MARVLLIVSQVVSTVLMVLGTLGSAYYTYALFFKAASPAVALVIPVFIFVSIVLLVGGIALFFTNRFLARQIRESTLVK